MVFRTKVDIWLLGVVVLALGFGLGSSLLAFLRDREGGWIGLVAIAAATAFVLGISVPTEYIVTDRELVVRSGVLRSRIPLDSIERVSRTHNPLSAPAWSLDRIRIDYRAGGVRRFSLISPRRQAEFLSLLRQRVPSASVDP